MADINYAGRMPAEIGDSAPVSTGIGRTINVLGAAASLALLAGIGIWGYKLVMRDVSGVPVVRALEGPMRVQPDDPGGQQADHQGLAVNAVAARGTAEAPADRLMLAPRPVQLTKDDAPGRGETVTPAVLADKPALPKSSDRSPAVDASDAEVVEALVEQLTAGMTPDAGAADTTGSVVTEAALRVTPPTQDATPTGDTETAAVDATNAKPDADNVAIVQPAVLTGPGLARSLRPLARPARGVTGGDTSGNDPVLASAITAAVDTVAGLEVEAADLPKGTRLAQLGAYDSPEVARSEWDKLAIRFEDYLSDKKRVVQKASSGGRTFYRLRAVGFADISDARRFCSALVAEKADCIPVTVR